MPLADLDTMLPGPGPHLGARPPRCRLPPPPGLTAAARLVGMIDERRQLRPEPAGISSAQVDLIIRSTESEPKGVGAEYGVTSCDLRILTEEAAEPVPALNPGVAGRAGRNRASGGRSLLQRPVRAVHVVVIGVFAKD